MLRAAQPNGWDRFGERACLLAVHDARPEAGMRARLGYASLPYCCVLQLLLVQPLISMLHADGGVGVQCPISLYVTLVQIEWLNCGAHDDTAMVGLSKSGSPVLVCLNRKEQPLIRMHASPNTHENTEFLQRCAKSPHEDLSSRPTCLFQMRASAIKLVGRSKDIGKRFVLAHVVASLNCGYRRLVLLPRADNSGPN